MKTKILILALFACITTAFSQTAPAPLDTIPGFSGLTNLPTATFDAAKFEVFLGLENTGPDIQNQIAVHANVLTNFFVAGQLSLGGNSHVADSAGLSLGMRKVWKASELYSGLGVIRNWKPNLETFQGEGYFGYAYRPSSGFAVYGQLEIFVSKNNAAPALGYVCGVALAF